MLPLTINLLFVQSRKSKKYYYLVSTGRHNYYISIDGTSKGCSIDCINILDYYAILDNLGIVDIDAVSL